MGDSQTWGERDRQTNKDRNRQTKTETEDVSKERRNSFLYHILHWKRLKKGVKSPKMSQY